MIFHFSEIFASFAECLITIFFLNNFIGEQRKKDKKLFKYSAVLFTLLAIDNVLLSQLKGFELISILIMIILCSIYTYCFLSKNLVYNTICILLNVFIIISIGLLSLSITSFFSKTSVSQLQNERNFLRVLLLVYSKLIYFIAIYFAVSKKRNSKMKIHRNDWSIIFAFFLSTFFMYNVAWVISSEISHENSLILVLLLLGIISVNIAIFPLLNHLSKENIRKSELLLISQHIEKQRVSVNIIQENYMQIRKLKHDMKTYINSINLLISNGETEKAIKFGNDIISDKIFTDFDTLNSVLNVKVKNSKEKGIDFGFLITDKISILGDMEINIVIMNLVDNAIEASSEIPNAAIHLTISRKKSYLNILMTNKILSSVLAENPNLETTKKDSDNHGFGIKSIRDIIGKYNGTIEFYEKDNFFCADVLIPVD